MTANDAVSSTKKNFTIHLTFTLSLSEKVHKILYWLAVYSWPKTKDTKTGEKIAKELRDKITASEKVQRSNGKVGKRRKKRTRLKSAVDAMHESAMDLLRC